METGAWSDIVSDLIDAMKETQMNTDPSAVNLCEHKRHGLLNSSSIVIVAKVFISRMECSPAINQVLSM